MHVALHESLTPRVSASRPSTSPADIYDVEITISSVRRVSRLPRLPLVEV